MHESDFHIDVRDRGNLLVLALHGELDLATADDVRAAIAEHGADRAALVLDLRGLTFMDSSGINLLVRLHARPGGTAVAFVAPPAVVGQTLDVTQVRRHLTWVDTPEQALEDH
jgi:anti-sigma B factor antagonist